MYIRTTGIIGRACTVRINYRKWVGTSVNSTDPLHLMSQFRCSGIACLRSYSFPNVTSESIKDRKFSCIFGLCSMLLLWNNCWQVSGNIGELQDLTGACLFFVVVAASGTMMTFSVDVSNNFLAEILSPQWRKFSVYTLNGSQDRGVIPDPVQ